MAVIDELQALLATKIMRVELNPKNVIEYKTRTPTIYCNDGTHLSVQTGEFNYCDPKTNTGPWTEVEVGFPSREFESLKLYEESNYSDNSGIYGYVPIEVIVDIINECGGICHEWITLHATHE